MEVRQVRRDIWVDFNDVDEHCHASALLRHSTPGTQITAGAWVIAGDDDGNLCRARVVDVQESGLVELALDMCTFQTVEAQTLASA